ncbi:MAG: LacI family DNA-binding transcriptional regulator [Candidatus Omnitrophica bacterium]|nr:LacI family DNA-binding transcriptional regulator [Candidatus Omnitrophota bacterium]
MAAQKSTINDVAREAGVSIATVSRFLNNPSSIKEENRKKVEKTVKKLKYSPLLYARKLAGGKSGVYGLIIPGYEGVFYSFYAMEIIRGIGFVLESLNIDLYLHIFRNKDKFNSSLVDGVIFADIIGNDNQLKRVIKEKIPCVVINKIVDELEVSSVTIDNFKGGYLATEFLINHGHKNIVHIAGDLEVQCARERLEGYKSALIKNNIKIKDSYIKTANFSRLKVKKCMEECFSGKNNFTAVFAASDEMAAEVITFAQDKGLEVPQQISVVGFDDNPFCNRYNNIGITTVRQPLQQMASSAVNILKKLIEKKKEIKKIIFPPELVIRDSVVSR